MTDSPYVLRFFPNYCVRRLWLLFQFTGNLKDTGFAMRKITPQRGAEPTPERCRLAVPAGEMARRAMAAAAWTVALAALLLPRAEAQLQAYTDNVTGYVAGSSLITNAQCREVRALGRADALVETTPATPPPTSRLPRARARRDRCARRLFRSESCFSCARARVLFVQKVALGEREL